VLIRGRANSQTLDRWHESVHSEWSPVRFDLRTSLLIGVHLRSNFLRSTGTSHGEQSRTGTIGHIKFRF
jgi:hypothetical protein